LHELINDKARRRAFGASARKRVSNSFSLKRMVNELEQLYLSLT